MKKIALLVVLYNKTIEESATINELVNFNLENIAITVVNNGPIYIPFDGELFESIKSKSYTIKTFTFLGNKPLSEIYNNFIKENSDIDEYTFFDDDSRPQKNYMRILQQTNIKYDVLAPKILSVSDNKIYYPLEDKRIIANERFLDAKTTISISSGLSVSKRTVELISKENGNVFDQRFALYGIDTSFFIRLNRLCKQGENINIYSAGTIQHSLSRVETKLTKFRLKERMYDIAISARYYPEYVSRYFLFKKLIKFLLLAKFNMIILLLVSYCRGTHPRCSLSRVKK